MLVCTSRQDPLANLRLVAMFPALLNTDTASVSADAIDISVNLSIGVSRQLKVPRGD